MATCTSSTCTDTLSQLYVSDTAVLFKLTNGLTSLSNCVAQTGVYLTVQKATSANYNSFYTMLLSASLTKQTLTIRLVDNSNPCTVSYMYMNIP